MHEPLKNAKIGSHSLHFGLTSANSCGSGSDFLFDADADPYEGPGYQNDVDPCGSGSTTLPSPTKMFKFGYGFD
jgi:hypothetical protein